MGENRDLRGCAQKSLSVKRKRVRSLNFRDRWDFVIFILIFSSEFHFIFIIFFPFFFFNLAIIVLQEGKKLIDYSATRPVVGGRFQISISSSPLRHFQVKFSTPNSIFVYFPFLFFNFYEFFSIFWIDPILGFEILSTVLKNFLLGAVDHGRSSLIAIPN